VHTYCGPIIAETKTWRKGRRDEREWEGGREWDGGRGGGNEGEKEGRGRGRERMERKCLNTVQL